MQREIVQIPAPQLVDWTGKVLGTSQWQTIEQSQFVQYARVCGQADWLRFAQFCPTSNSDDASAGYFCLSLLPALVSKTYSVTQVSSRINYGFEQLRFLAPVSFPAKVRAHIKLLDVTPRGEHQIRAITEVSIQAKGRLSPVVQVTMLALYQCEKERAE